MKSEMWLKIFLPISIQDKNVLRFCRTQIFCVKITGLIQNFSMINHYAVALLPLYFYLYPANKVLSKINQLFPFGRFKCSYRLKYFMFSYGLVMCGNQNIFWT